MFIKIFLNIMNGRIVGEHGAGDFWEIAGV